MYLNMKIHFVTVYLLLGIFWDCHGFSSVTTKSAVARHLVSAAAREQAERRLRARGLLLVDKRPRYLYWFRQCVLDPLYPTDPPFTRVGPKHDTIVVGLGSAGTTAATTLARAGKRVLALEAQDRIGGRVHTLPLEDGVVELGAEWIHGTEHNRVYDAAMQAHIPILSQDTVFNTLKSDGSHVNRKMVQDIMNKAGEAIEDPLEHAQSLKEAVTNRLMEHIKEAWPELLNDTELLNGVLNCVYQQINTLEASNDPGDVTTASEFEELPGNVEMSWHTYGYKTFFELMLNTYKNGSGLPTVEIKLNTEVTQIKYPQDPKDNVEVTTKDGTVYHAKNVIVTVSLGVLKERHATLFSPPLPKGKANAIKVISMGLLGKIILLFDDHWWSPNKNDIFGFIWKEEDKQKLPADDRWMLDVIGPWSSMGNNHSMTLWTTGDTSKHVETLSEEVVKTKCMQILRMFMGVNKTIPEPTRIIRTTWHSNPFTRGSYSYDNLLTPQYPDARKTLAQPLTDSAGNPRVLFAGEATNQVHFASVHGASETGFREASRLLGEGKNYEVVGNKINT